VVAARQRDRHVGERTAGRGAVGVAGDDPVAEGDQPADDGHAGGAAGAGDEHGSAGGR
jgi:hypothetical protein